MLCTDNRPRNFARATTLPMTPRFAAPEFLRTAILAGALLCSGAPRAQEAPQTLPSFAQLQAMEARVGEIRITNRNIFDTDDPREDKLLFRWANALHFQTRVGVIERALLFKSGEPLSVRLIEETERILRSVRYLYDVQIRPVAYRDGAVDIEVLTRDSWTLDPSISVSRSGGANSSSIKLNEYNLLGTGVSLSYGRSRNVDRTSNQFQFANDRAFGGWTSLAYSHSSNSDGTRDTGRIAHPFYALDTPWAASLTAERDDRIEAVYSGGVIASQYRYRREAFDAWGGWSQGRIDGWVRRYSIGLSGRGDRYAPEPGLVAPTALPPDETQIAPYLRFELIEDRIEKVERRNQLGRPEFFAVGLSARLQLGAAPVALGSTRNAVLYNAAVSRGFAPGPAQTLLASAETSGEYTGDGIRRHRLGAQASYFLPQSKTWLFYAKATADTLTHPDANDSLLLGGDSGLRGFPLRYQSGYRRALLTLEERAYTDVYPFRLFRIGGAVFVDVGRAWGDPNSTNPSPRWLSNTGLGLRIFSVRAAFSTVLHLDVAFPNDPDANVKGRQFLVKTLSSF
jgi:hypothetical protein